MPKRSSKPDVAQIAHRILQQVTGEAAPEEPQPEKKKNPAAVALGRLGGLKGGKARAEKLTAKKRSEIAKKAAKEFISRLARTFGEPSNGEANSKSKSNVAGVAASAAPALRRRRTDSGVFDKVAAVFVHNGNKPITREEIAAAAHITEGSLHTLIYTTKSASFHRLDHPDGGKKKIFALTAEALQAARAA